MDEAAEPAKPKLSRTPSWIMLGFVLGVLFVVLLPDREPVEIPAPAEKIETPVIPPPRLTTVESQFEAYGKYAVWENDTTEIRVWNPDAKTFVDSYEVMRAGDRLYFRSITKLSRPLLDHGIPENLPLQFTEPESQRKQWLKAVTTENVKTFLGGLTGKSGAESDTSKPAPPSAPSVAKP